MNQGNFDENQHQNIDEQCVFKNLNDFKSYYPISKKKVFMLTFPFLIDDKHTVYKDTLFKIRSKNYINTKY